MKIFLICLLLIIYLIIAINLQEMLLMQQDHLIIINIQLIMIVLHFRNMDLFKLTMLFIWDNGKMDLDGEEENKYGMMVKKLYIILIKMYTRCFL